VHLICAWNTSICFIWLSARNGGITVAGISDVIKENGHDALHFPPNSINLNPIELICSNIKKQKSMYELEGSAGILQRSIS
jgi:transposase